MRTNEVETNKHRHQKENEGRLWVHGGSIGSEVLRLVHSPDHQLQLLACLTTNPAEILRVETLSVGPAIVINTMSFWPLQKLGAAGSLNGCAEQTRR